jgi:hypothetical protein
MEIVAKHCLFCMSYILYFYSIIFYVVKITKFFALGLLDKQSLKTALLPRIRKVFIL